MRLEGWNHVPEGYGAQFRLDEAPRWLKVWFHCPFLDRWAYPIVVRRGYGVLTPHPGWPPARRGPVPPGWRVTNVGD